MKVRSLNLNLDLLSKDRGMKLGGIVEYYKILDRFCENYKLLKILC
jgi:hypothetical protein